MDRSLDVPIAVLQLLGRCTRKLAEFANEIRQERGVRSVSSRVECLDYLSGPTLEGYVDAELDTGNAITWWVEIPSLTSENCSVLTEVLVNTGEGQERLMERKPATIGSFEDLERELGGAIDWLRSQKGVLE